MLNWIVAALIVGATITGAYNGTMEAVTKASIDSAKSAVELAIGLVGQMALWLGLMRVLQDGGLVRAVSRKLGKLLRPLFPELPPGDPALGAIVMNLAANMVGLANAATPFGLKAMRELDRLNTRKGVATNSMALFLAINTSGVAVLPLGVIAIRATLGSVDPAGILVPSILATTCSTLTAIVIAKWLESWRVFGVERYPAIEEPGATNTAVAGLEKAEAIVEKEAHATGWRRLLLPGFAVAFAFAVFLRASSAPAETTTFELVREVLSQWILPFLISAIIVYGVSRRVRVYESIVSGAKEGFDVAIMIIPFLVAMLVAIGMFRASGMFDVVLDALRPAAALVGFPPETLPMALIRPLSGSGALSVLMDTLKTHGKDSFIGFVTSVMNGSTETTFYVLAVYYGSVRIRRERHTLFACLAADVVGLTSAVFISRAWFY